jgi:hypothetical protein
VTRVCIALVVALAALPRIAWYARHQPELPPDAYSYLNVAREWRGERAPEGRWDDRAQMPWDNEGARTPTYPLFLNLVFALARHTPTPESALAGPRRILSTGEPGGARAVHLKHLETDENVKAVQGAQHALGVIAAAVAFLTLLQWTGSRLAATVGSLLSVGWNPVWITTYEPSVMTEILSGVLLLVGVWLATRRSERAVHDHLAAAACALAMTIRPPMLVSAAPILAFLVWKQRRRGVRALAVLAMPVALAALVIVNNGLRYGYWALASMGGGTMMSHAAKHPEGLRPPFDAFADRIRGNRDGGQLLLYVLSVEQHVPYLQASREIQRAAVGFAFDHPMWFMQSVAEAFVEFCSPPFRLVGANVNALRQREPIVWLAISGAATIVLVAGVAGVFLPLGPSIKLGALVYLVSAIGLSFAAHTENKRFAAPTVPLALMTGVSAIFLTAVPRSSRSASSPGEAFERSRRP